MITSNQPVSFSQIIEEIGLSSNQTVSLDTPGVRFLAAQALADTTQGNATPGQIASFSNFWGKAWIVPGSTGIITTSGNITLPVTTGPVVNILTVGGGGGGGGGSSRTSKSGQWSGGGGGGSGDVRVNTVGITPGQTLSITIGTHGVGGTARDGGYTAGTNGTNGSTTYVRLSAGGTVIAVAGGGSGGLVSSGTGAYYTSGGPHGIEPSPLGDQVLSPQNGGSVNYYDFPGGGSGGIGVNIDPAPGATSPYSYGTQGLGGVGNDTGNTGALGTNPAYSGTGFGAGGGGGGKDNEFKTSSGYINGAAGTGGAVLIWWGY